MNEIIEHFQTLQKSIEDYEELFQQIIVPHEKDNLDELDIKQIETQFDQFQEVLNKNKNILDMEKKTAEITEMLINNLKETSLKIKNEYKMLSYKNNKYVDIMMENNKQTNKENNKEEYHALKNQLNKMYVETDELLRKRELKRIKKENKLKEEAKLEKEKSRKMKKKKRKEDEIEKKKNKEYDYEFTIVFLGSGAVGGKSTFIQRYVEGKPRGVAEPTIEETFYKTLERNGKIIHLTILDTAGTDQFKVMQDLYMKNGHGFILTYSMTAISSFNDLESYDDHLTEVKNAMGVKRQDYVKILTGNKCDVESDRDVTYEQGKQFAEERGFDAFFETSALRDINVNETFDKMVDLLIEKADKKMKHQEKENKPPTKEKSTKQHEKECIIC